MTLKIYFVTSCFLVLLSSSVRAQEDSAAVNSIHKFQRELNAEYKDPKASPLDPEKLKDFEGHDFFPMDLKYSVEAVLTVTDKEPYFKMMTSNNQPRNYRQYGILEFTLEGQLFKLPVYQSQKLMETEEYADYLFFPFTDLTNGDASYSAGRYIDLRIPEKGNTVTVDFNKAYNPLCAYSNRYSCPIVPEKNHIQLEIRAGVRHDNSH